MSVLLLLCSLLASCSALVPLIGWSNSVAFSSITGSQYSSANQFIFDASLDGIDVVVIFKTPELSFDTLAKYGGVFGGKNPVMAALQVEVQGSKSSAWVGVAGSVASDLIRTLSFIMDVQPHVITGADGLTEMRKLVQVELVSSSETAGFSEQDDVISEVMSALHALPGSPSYAAIYTSSHAHLPRPSFDEQEIRRSADVYEDNVFPRAADQEATATASSSEPICANVFDVVGNGSHEEVPCLSFCFTHPRIIQRNSTTTGFGEDDQIPYNLTNLQILDGSCSNDTDVCGPYGAACLKATAEVNDTNELVPLDFTFVFPKGSCDNEEGGETNIRCGFWTLELYVEDIRYRRAREEQHIFSQLLIPYGASYACGDNELNVFQPVVTNNNETDNLGILEEYKFFGLQIQLFAGITLDSKGNPVFGSAYNCQGYISTVPLMGLVSLVILLLILYCSVLFLFSIKTQDRFDDPRGPTITVENLH